MRTLKFNMFMDAMLLVTRGIAAEEVDHLVAYFAAARGSVVAELSSAMSATFPTVIQGSLSSMLSLLSLGFHPSEDGQPYLTMHGTQKWWRGARPWLPLLFILALMQPSSQPSVDRCVERSTITKIRLSANKSNIFLRHFGSFKVDAQGGLMVYSVIGSRMSLLGIFIVLLFIMHFFAILSMNGR